MKTVITLRITKFILVITLILIAMIGRGQCTVITPGPVTGAVNVCPFIGTGDQITYSIDAIPFATTYEWLVPPTNVTVISGQGTTSLTVTYQNGFESQVNKRIRVRAIYPCGTSEYFIKYLAVQSPQTPGLIATGATNLCPFVGTGNAVSYTINSVPGASSYNWQSPANTTILHPNGAGVNDTTILLTLQTGFSGGFISVTSANNCGVSQERHLPISINTPPKPGLIAGATNVCTHIAPSGTPLTYAVHPITGALSYTWNVPAGAIVTHPNGTGPNDFTISVLYPDGFSSGIISVSVTNECGTSPDRTLTVNRLLPSAPGDVMATQISSCPGRVFIYAVASMPLNSSSIQWTVPERGEIINGQGTTSITVSYADTAINGVITAVGVSSCGTSNTRSVNVNLGVCGSGLQSTLVRNSSKNMIPGNADIMILSVYPNPSAGDFKVMISSKESGDISVRIRDMSGKLLRRLALRRNESVVFGNDLKPGTYLMEVIQGNSRKVQKLIKF